MRGSRSLGLTSGDRPSADTAIDWVSARMEDRIPVNIGATGEKR